MLESLPPLVAEMSHRGILYREAVQVDFLSYFEAQALQQIAEASGRELSEQVDVDYTLGKDIFSLRGTYVRENSSLQASLAAAAADRIRHHLDAFNANAEYHFGNRYSAAFGWFTTSGTSDATDQAAR